MADGINVGSVLVSVLPDARGWDERLNAEVTPAAEAIGRKIGKALEDDIADGVRRGMEKAKLELEGLTGGDIKVNVDVDNTAALAKLAEVDVAAKDAQKSAAASAGGIGPLIAAAIAGGLALGGPAIVGAAGVAAAGVAAVFLRNQQDVAASAKEMATQVKGAYDGIADGAIPSLTTALQKLRDAAFQVAPQVRDLFNNLDPAIQGVTDGVIGLAEGALPGLISMVKNGAPVFDGLKNFLTSIGTGLGDMFRILSEHSQAFGQVFTSLGDVLHAILPALGDLMAAGGELGSMILPPLASALGLVSDVLHLIAPVLPVVAEGFGAFKIAQVAGGWLTSLAGQVEAAGAKMAAMSWQGELANIGMQKVSGALSGIAPVLPLIGVGVGIITAAITTNTQRLDSWADALVKGGAAARQANEEMDKAPGAWDRFSFAITHGGNSVGVVGKQMEEAKAKADALIQAMDPLHRAQTLATQAQNNLSDALGRKDAVAAAGYLAEYQKQTAEAQRQQNLLNAALHNSTAAEEQNTARLQGLANAAGAGNTQINLLKGALDQLTGKAVSLGDAEVAVTNAVDAAKTALQGKTGALVTATGAVNTHTTAGAALWQSMTQIAGADNTLIATMEKQGATSAEVSAKDAELRQQFIDTAIQMGLSAGQANNLANQIYGIPEQRKTEITADTAQATQAVADLQARIAAIQSKTITVGVNYHVAGLNGGPGGTQLANAQGNIVHAYADGGMEPNMPGGTAAIVPPQTYRIIGDRVTDDEAYIPINNSLRSLQILAQTASRMNYQLTPAGHSGGRPAGGGHFTGTLVLDSGEFLGVVRGELDAADHALANDVHYARG